MAAQISIDFGVLSHLANLRHFSYSAWVRRDKATTQPIAVIAHSSDPSTYLNGNYFATTGDGFLQFVIYKSVSMGEWITTNNAVPGYGSWHHIAVVYDNVVVTPAPIFYVDGVVCTYTEHTSPSGTTNDDSNCPLMLLNLPAAPATGQKYSNTLIYNSSIKDIRIYDHLLTTTEIAALYAGEDDYSTVPIGKLFHGIYVPTDNITDYTGDTITDDDLVLECVFGAAGIPYHSGDMLTGEAI